MENQYKKLEDWLNSTEAKNKVSKIKDTISGIKTISKWEDRIQNLLLTLDYKDLNLLASKYFSWESRYRLDNNISTNIFPYVCKAFEKYGEDLIEKSNNKKEKVLLTVKYHGFLYKTSEIEGQTINKIMKSNRTIIKTIV